MRIEPQYTSFEGVLTLLLLLHTTYKLCANRFPLLRGTIHAGNIERTIKTVIARSGDGHAYNRGMVVYERLVQLRGFDWEKFSVFDLWPLKGGGILRGVVVLEVSSKFKCQKRGQKGGILRLVYPAADSFNTT